MGKGNFTASTLKYLNVHDGQSVGPEMVEEGAVKVTIHPCRFQYQRIKIIIILGYCGIV